MTRNFCSVLSLLLVVGFTTAQSQEPTPGPSMPAPPAKPWNVRDHIPLSQFVIQSHRGAGELAPENTIEAVREYYAKPRP